MMSKIKNALEILNEIMAIPTGSSDLSLSELPNRLKPAVCAAIQTYGDQYSSLLEKQMELKAEDVSFHYATIESEMREELISKISNMIYEAIPTGEVDTFTLIKILKKLKTDIEAL